MLVNTAWYRRRLPRSQIAASVWNSWPLLPSSAALSAVHAIPGHRSASASRPSKPESAQKDACTTFRWKRSVENLFSMLSTRRPSPEVN
ncbi:hypothetical protein BN1708_015570 [Verticillium longisporum]|uniref:Uncharacterized protein n=1 Tax=Verticillium longisporum TaxID=100787 RepID=A0A0G4M5A7_VERLO|nr:hypothetical protein BN1708_015570 [Verticillium longisporum]